VEGGSWDLAEGLDTGAGAEADGLEQRAPDVRARVAQRQPDERALLARGRRDAARQRPALGSSHREQKKHLRVAHAFAREQKQYLRVGHAFAREQKQYLRVGHAFASGSVSGVRLPWNVSSARSPSLPGSTCARAPPPRGERTRRVSDTPALCPTHPLCVGHAVCARTGPAAAPAGTLAASSSSSWYDTAPSDPAHTAPGVRPASRELHEARNLSEVPVLRHGGAGGNNLEGII